MNNGKLQSRWALLPARDKFMPLVIAFAAAYAVVAIFLAHPSAYTSSAVVAYRSPVQGLVLQSTPPLVPLAAAILTPEALAHGAASVAPADPQRAGASGVDASSLPSHLSLAGESSESIRVTWTASTIEQSLDGLEVLTSILTSWNPAIEPARDRGSNTGHDARDSAGADPGPDASQDPNRAKEQALLRTTMAVLDVKIAELNGKLHAANFNHTGSRQPNRPALKQQLQRYQSQRSSVAQRLAESTGDQPQIDGKSGARSAHPSRQSDTAPNGRRSSENAIEGATTIAPFTVTTRDSRAHPVYRSWVAIAALAAIAAVALALLYLLIALWWFRPVNGIASLAGILPIDELLVGTIGDISR